MKKFLIITIITGFISFELLAITPFNEGKELFKDNSVEEALFLFEEALITNPTVDTYKYLAESYNILGLHDDETLVLEEAIFELVGEQSYFYFKLGNAYYLVGDFKNALDSYLEVLKLKKDYVNEAFLNIANVSVELELYSSAIDNYTKYLELEPNSAQKRKIIKMIFLLKKQHREQLTELDNERIVEEEDRLAESFKTQKKEEARFEQNTLMKTLESERAVKARELQEQRLLYDNAEKLLLEDQLEFEVAEEKVLNPPDPDIEARRTLLQLREKELNERESRLVATEQALIKAERVLNQNREDAMESNIQAPDDFVTDDNEGERIAAESARQAEELAILKAEEEVHQQALMNDILQSLEKIGENAKGINASSESAFGELERSDIDE